MHKSVCFLILIISTICFFSCDDDDVPLRKSIVIVLCDVSNSTTKFNAKIQEGGMLDSLKSYVQKIPKCYPLETKILFYPISDNGKVSPIGAEIIYQNLANSDWKAQDSAIQNQIMSIKSNIDSLAIACSNSCILKSIESTVATVEDYKKNEEYKDCDFQLIIISDMVEACNETNIRLHAFDNMQLKKSLAYFSNYQPRTNLGNNFNKVKIIMNVPYLSDENATLIKDAWVKLFSRMGLSENKNLDFYQRTFTMQVLDVFKN